MSYVPALRSIRPLWITAAVVLVAGCQALVGDLPDPAELASDGSGGEASDGGRTGSGGRADSGGNGDGGTSDGGGGGTPQSGGGAGAGGVGGSGGRGSGGASTGGAIVEPPDGGDGGDGSVGGVDGGGGTSAGGTASGGTGGASTGGATGGVAGSGGVATGGATGGTGGATGGTGGATGGTGTGGSVTCTTDADTDGYISKACGGPDCDDSDDLVRPNQTAYFDKASNGGTYDYNCNVSVEYDPALNRFTVCTNLALLDGCNKPEAFLGSSVPACGVAQNWGTCKNGILGSLVCANAPRTQMKMACR